MVHWTQVSLKKNREFSESVILAYYDKDNGIDKLDYERLLFEIQMKLGCSERKAIEYYQWVMRKIGFGI